MSNLHEMYQKVFSNDKSYVLDSVYEIENLLLLLKEVSSKIDFYKGLKKFRAEEIDKLIEGLEFKDERIRSVILNTMKLHEPQKKTVNFPSVGKVTKRAAQDDWEINNEEDMIKFFTEHGIKGQVVKVEEKLIVKEAKKMLSSFEEQKIRVPGTTRIETKENVNVSFEKSGLSTEVKSVESQRKKEESEVVLSELDL